MNIHRGLSHMNIHIGVYHAIVCLSNNVLFGRMSGFDLACNVLYAGLEGCGYGLWLPVYEPS